MVVLKRNANLSDYYPLIGLLTHKHEILDVLKQLEKLRLSRATKSPKLFIFQFHKLFYIFKYDKLNINFTYFTLLFSTEL